MNTVTPSTQTLEGKLSVGRRWRYWRALPLKVLTSASFAVVLVLALAGIVVGSDPAPADPGGADAVPTAPPAIEAPSAQAGDPVSDAQLTAMSVAVYGD